MIAKFADLFSEIVKRLLLFYEDRVYMCYKGALSILLLPNLISGVVSEWFPEGGKWATYQHN